MWTPSALRSERRRLAGTAWRAVEAQHIVSTQRLADSADDQALLEEMLEESKPPVPEPCRRLHYLLSTPFRYQPPWPYGSRFRRPYAPYGVFYAAEAARTALAELAFYRLLFFEAMEEPVYPRHSAQITVFPIDYVSDAGLDLLTPPLDRDRERWTDPRSYAHTQQLGEAAVEAGVQILRYESARDPEGGACIGILDCCAFASHEPGPRQTWMVHLYPRQVQIRRAADRGPGLIFQREDFTLNDRLLQPE